jgi:hypothetical protein
MSPRTARTTYTDMVTVTDAVVSTVWASDGSTFDLRVDDDRRGGGAASGGAADPPSHAKVGWDSCWLTVAGQARICTERSTTRRRGRALAASPE